MGVFEDYKIKCRECSEISFIPADWFKTGEIKTYSCPNCGHKMGLKVAKIRGEKYDNFTQKTVIVGTGTKLDYSLKITNPDFKSFQEITDIIEEIEIKRGNSLVFSEENNASRFILQLPDKYVSRNHAKITISKNNKNKILKYEDLGSLNGSLINSQKIEPGDEIFLKPKDLIKIGLTTIEICV